MAVTLIIFALLFGFLPQLTNGVWICRPKICEEFVQYPEFRRGNGSELDGAELEVQKSMTDDPQSHEVENDFQGCEKATRMYPGVEQMQYGYNIVTDEFTSKSVLNMSSTHLFNATKYDERTNSCYIVPDVFTKMGISTSGKASYNRPQLGAFNLKKYRLALVESRSSELQLDDAKYGIAGAAALYARSDKIRRLREFRAYERQSYSKISFTWLSYKWTVSTFIPTDEILAEWRRLFMLGVGGVSKEETAKAFNTYFESWGTHFYRIARAGGQISVLFTPKVLTAGGGVPKGSRAGQLRAKCIAQKVLRTLTEEGSVNCPNDATFDLVDAAPVSGLLHKLVSFCEGGETTKCPNSPADLETKPNTFLQWKNSIKSHPTPFGGIKFWITRLLDHILLVWTIETGAKGELYKNILVKFGGTNDVEQGANKLEQFKQLLSKQLVRYLKANEYCKVYPDECTEKVGPDNGQVCFH